MNVKAELDMDIYAELVAKIAPMVINSDKDYQRLLPVLETLSDRSVKEALSPEEDVLFELLATLVNKYENEKFFKRTREKNIYYPPARFWEPTDLCFQLLAISFIAGIISFILQSCGIFIYFLNTFIYLNVFSFLAAFFLVFNEDRQKVRNLRTLLALIFVAILWLFKLSFLWLLKFIR